MLTIDSGDTIAFACPNAGWWLSREERFEPRDPELDLGHALIGPVEVRGAKAGQTLEVRGGVGSCRAVGCAPWTLDPDRGAGCDQLGRELDLRPFLGVMGMPRRSRGVHPTQPPR